MEDGSSRRRWVEAAAIGDVEFTDLGGAGAVSEVAARAATC